ncbi:MAG: hypothetical protein KC656_03685 [Myxococcales bacterium]|nr:hypothetical protein [Myxococcales bacterium]
MPRPLLVLLVLAGCPQPSATDDTDICPPPTAAEPEMLPEDAADCSAPASTTQVRWIAFDVEDGGVRETATFRTPPGSSPHRVTLTTSPVRGADGTVLAAVFADLGEGDTRAAGLSTGDLPVSLVFEARPDVDLTLGVDLDISEAGQAFPSLGAGFTVEITTIPDCHEPNDTPDAASPIPTNVPVQGWLTRGESPEPTAVVDDWYGFVADGVSEYTVSWGDLPTGHATVVTVQDAAGNELAAAATWDGQDGPLALGVLAPGAVRVGFLPFVGSAASCGLDGGTVPADCGAVESPYWVQVDRVVPASPPDPNEPCDVPAVDPVVPAPPPPAPAPEAPPETGMPPGVTDPADADPFDVGIVGDLADPGPSWRGPYVLGSTLTGAPTATCGGRFELQWDASGSPALQGAAVDGCAFTPDGGFSWVYGTVWLEATPGADGLLHGFAYWDEEPVDGTPDGEGPFTGRFGVDAAGEPALVGSAELSMPVDIFGQTIPLIQELRLGATPYTPPPPPPPPAPLPPGVDGLWRFDLPYPGATWYPAWSTLDADGTPVLTPLLDGYVEALVLGSLQTAIVNVGEGAANGDQLTVTVASRSSAFDPEYIHTVPMAVGTDSLEAAHPPAYLSIFTVFGTNVGDFLDFRARRVGTPVAPAAGSWSGTFEVLDVTGSPVCSAVASASVDASGMASFDVQPCDIPAGALPQQPGAQQVPAWTQTADLGAAPAARLVGGLWEDLVAFSVDDGGAVLGADGRYSALPGAPTVALRLRLTPDP